MTFFYKKNFSFFLPFPLISQDAAGEFVEAVYPPGYDPSAPATKRKAPAAKREPAKKRARAGEEDSSADRDSLDMGSYASSKTVQKLTVAQLRGYLGSSGVATAGMKKAQLVQEVSFPERENAHCGFFFVFVHCQIVDSS